jgi:hypothetical protein
MAKEAWEGFLFYREARGFIDRVWNGDLKNSSVHPYFSEAVIQFYRWMRPFFSFFCGILFDLCHLMLLFTPWFLVNRLQSALRGQPVDRDPARDLSMVIAGFALAGSAFLFSAMVAAENSRYWVQSVVPAIVFGILFFQKSDRSSQVTKKT